MCEPALLKCTWTWHFVRKFTGKMADAPDTTSIEPQALTVTVTVRTPQCCHTVWGKKTNFIIKYLESSKEICGFNPETWGF
jgi:hypothetical protein